MWKVLLAFVSHRILLLTVAFISINMHLPGAPQKGLVPTLEPVSVLWPHFIHRATAVPEYAALQDSFSVPFREMVRSSFNPFLWCCRVGMQFLGFGSLAALLFFSNLFFVLFLLQLYSLLSRIVTEDIAASSVILLVLWPTTYELSLGSSFSLTCFLAMWGVRQALDNSWLLAGLAMGALALVEPLALGLLPLVLYLFYYFQRHFSAAKVVSHLGLFLVPVGLAVFWRYHAYGDWGRLLADSALLSVFSGWGNARTESTFVQSNLGQTIALVFLAAGTVFAFLRNTTVVHRLIPLYLFLTFLVFSPFGAIASRAPLAGVSMEGIAATSSRPVARIVKMLLLSVGVHEVFAYFR